MVVQVEFMARDSKGPQPRTDRSPLSNISANVFCDETNKAFSPKFEHILLFRPHSTYMEMEHFHNGLRELSKRNKLCQLSTCFYNRILLFFSSC